MNLALDALVEQQRTWSVPDVALRGNLRDAVLEDFMPTYRVSHLSKKRLPSMSHVCIFATL